MQISNSNWELIRNMSAEVIETWKKWETKLWSSRNRKLVTPQSLLTVLDDLQVFSMTQQSGLFPWISLSHCDSEISFLFMERMREDPVLMLLSKWFFSFLHAWTLDATRKVHGRRPDSLSVIKYQKQMSEIKVRRISKDTFIFPAKVIFRTSFQRTHVCEGAAVSSGVWWLGGKS